MGRAVLKHLAGAAAICLVILIPGTAHAATITVDTNSGAPLDGSCALEDAIKAANKDKKFHDCKAGNGTDRILFDLPGSTTIQPAQQLPDVTRPVTIDGTSQPGAAGEPGITLDEGPAATEGIEITGKHVTLKGFTISDFTFEGVRISGTDVKVFNNLIGVNEDGNSHPNGVGVSLETGGNTIGGVSRRERNVISGNSTYGVLAQGDGNRITGNYLGTDPTGTLPVPNTVGGASISSGAGSALKFNVISGNGGAGVVIDPQATRTVLDGNLIGTDAAGTFAIGNADVGVVAEGTRTRIGGSSGNLISGNAAEGIVLFNGAQPGRTIVQGNQIGTDAAGLSAISNGEAGIRISASQRNVIGGDTRAEGNVISGNEGDGVFIGNGQDSNGNTVSGNFIGLGSDGVTQVGNSEAGVRIDGDANKNVIGGKGKGEGNRISGNNTDGVQLTGVTPVGNSILRNSIFGTVGEPIDLFPNGVTPNDLGSPPDTDTGPNNLQNFPDLIGGNEQEDKIYGSLDSTPSTDFRIEFFISANTGDAKKFVAARTVTTNPSGHRNFIVKSTKPLHTGEYVTATATRMAGKKTSDTSELSATADISEGP